MKKIIFILLLTFIFSELFSINNKYAVFRTTGKVYFGNINNKKLLKKGDTINFDNKDKTLIIEKESEIVFYNFKGKFYGISKEGKYYNNQLDSYTNNNLTSKYFTYVWEEMNHKAHKEKLNVGGGVSRGKEMEKILMSDPADSSIIIANEINFKWNKSSSKNKNFYFYIYDLPNKIPKNLVYKKVLNDNSFHLKIDSSIFKNGNKYCWYVDTTSVIDKNNNPWTWIFEIADNKWINEFNTKLKIFEKDFKTNNEYKYLSLAFFCYDNKVFPLAKYYYYKAFEISKGDDKFIIKAGVFLSK
jgi:hypothetical protein